MPVSLQQKRERTAFDKLQTTVSAHRLQILLALAPVVAVIGRYGAWYWPTLFGPPQDAGRVIVSGNVEAHESVLSVTQVQAPIVYLPFDEGAYVKRDTVLARLDDSLHRQQIDRTDLDVVTAQISANESTGRRSQQCRQRPLRPCRETVGSRAR